MHRISLSRHPCCARVLPCAPPFHRQAFGAERERPPRTHALRFRARTASSHVRDELPRRVERRSRETLTRRGGATRLLRPPFQAVLSGEVLRLIEHDADEPERLVDDGGGASRELVEGTATRPPADASASATETSCAFSGPSTRASDARATSSKDALWLEVPLTGSLQVRAGPPGRRRIDAHKSAALGPPAPGVVLQPLSRRHPGAVAGESVAC